MIELGPGLTYTQDIKGAILLDVTDIIPDIPAQITVDDTLLERKREFHWTVLVPRYIVPEDLAREEAIAARVGEFAAHHVLRATGLLPEYYLCHKPNAAGETQCTVVQKLAVEGVNDLWEYLIATEGLQLEAPFPHVTLYKSANSPYGIGVNNAHDRATYCEVRSDIAELLTPPDD